MVTAPKLYLVMHPDSIGNAQHRRVNFYRFRYLYLVQPRGLERETSSGTPGYKKSSSSRWHLCKSQSFPRFPRKKTPTPLQKLLCDRKAGAGRPR
ncbi:hypothetical protein TSAR_001000 [Trichomalopsis sarcophagae]|uniref:Uncharacterized protein n=1 Tax=Trichomalopsis sarcophagae TaxID=543379 RepID=A0A232FGN7_9HYME|nr:hypothetical protein TSAR_001000 [Trichomalopsis sarcophagae]